MCVPAYPQHIDGVGNRVSASLVVIKPGDTPEPLVVMKGRRKKGDDGDDEDDECFPESFFFFNLLFIAERNKKTSKNDEVL